jgi:hypothetical protein
MPRPHLASLLLLLSTGCTDDAGDESSESSTDEIGTSESGQSTESSDDSTSAGSTESTESSTESSTGSSSTESGPGESTESTESDSAETSLTTDTSGETGVIEPIECPLVEGDTVEVALYGVAYDFATETETPLASADCSLPASALLGVGDSVGPEYIAFGTNGCEDGLDIWLEGDFLLPNNNWAPIAALEFGTCYEFRFFTEPDPLDGCRFARLDVYELDAPELPIYSLGSTTTHLDVGGLVVEPIDPIPCTAECTSGEVHGLRFTAGAGEAELAPGEFPWTTLDTGSFDLQVIRYDAFTLTPSQDPNCPGGEPLERAAWAAKRP